LKHSYCHVLLDLEKASCMYRAHASDASWMEGASMAA